MRRLFFIFALLFSAQFVVAQNSAELQQQIENKAKTIESLTADFTQTRSVESLVKPAVSQGVLYFSRPDKMRWEQKMPISMILTIDGVRAQIKQGDATAKEFDLSTNKMFGQLGAIITGGITGIIFRDHKNYTITYTKTSGQTKAKLEPKSRQLSRFIASIELSFNSEWIADQIVIVESTGSKMVIDLRSIKINNTIDHSLFDLK